MTQTYNKQTSQGLYEELMQRKFGLFEKSDLGEDMMVVNELIGGYFKPFYLVDHRKRKAYEWINYHETLLSVTPDDIDWKALKKINPPTKALDRAERLSFHFPSHIYKFEGGVAVVCWQLNPSGRYYMDEDGYGMTDDKELDIYGVIDREGKVVVKFRPIQKYEEPDEMRKEGQKVVKLRANKE